MSWPVAEGRHYLPPPAGWCYGSTGRGTSRSRPAAPAWYSRRRESGVSRNGMGYGTSSHGGTAGTATGYGGDQDFGVSHADYGASQDGDRRAPAAAARYGASRGEEPVVSFENVSKQYGSLRAVDGLTLDLRQGETVALLGPNGAGKSTSLDMLLALRKPTAGRIEMFGSDPYHAVKSGRVGAMLQSGGLMPEVTVRELVTLVTKLHPKPEPVQATLKRAGIAAFADQRVDRLSGGQTQRVRFALASCGQTELIVLDEPTTAMDVETRRLFWASMKEEVAGGRTPPVATHPLGGAAPAGGGVAVRHTGAGEGRDKQAPAQQAVHDLHGGPAGDVLPDLRQAESAGVPGLVRGLLHGRDGLLRRVQRSAQQQRDAYLAGTQGRVGQAVAAHAAAGQRLRGGQGAGLDGDHGAVDPGRLPARPVLRRRPAAGLEVDRVCDRDLDRHHDLRRAGGRPRLQARSGFSAAGRPRRVLLLLDLRRPVVSAQRRAAQDRRVHAHLPDRQAQHGHHPGGQRGAGQRGRRRDLAGDLRRAGHMGGAGHRGDGLTAGRDMEER